MINIKKYFNSHLSIFQHITTPMKYFIQIILFLGIGHWALIQLYSSFCAPWSFYGLIQTFLSLGSPTCHFINYIQFEMAKHYMTVWASAAAAVVLYLVNRFKPAVPSLSSTTTGIPSKSQLSKKKKKVEDGSA